MSENPTEPLPEPIEGKVERFTSREEQIGLNILLFTFVFVTCAVVIAAGAWLVIKMLDGVL